MLANGFAACDEPAALQRICDRLGPADIQAFAARWSHQAHPTTTSAHRHEWPDLLDS